MNIIYFLRKTINGLQSVQTNSDLLLLQYENRFIIQVVTEVILRTKKTIIIIIGLVFFISSFFWQPIPIAKSSTTVPTIVKDLNPGANGGISISGEGEYPLPEKDFVKLGDYYYFDGNNPEVEHELFRTDGTVDGTTLVKDINPNGSSYPTGFQELNNKLYFLVQNDSAEELWVTDGTSKGTTKIYQFQVIQEFKVYNNKIYFSAYTFDNGQELWVSDGTTQGTHLLKDINTGEADGFPESSVPSNFTIYNGCLYFGAVGEVNTIELWKTDGTEIGTVRVSNFGKISEEPTGGHLNYLGVVGNVLVLEVANLEFGGIWRSDGTSNGTIKINNDVFGLYDSIIFKDKLYFRGDPVSNSGNYELWVCDGTSEGTHLFKDFRNDNSGYPAGFAIYNGFLYFSAFDGRELNLWRSDGTLEGTTVVKSIYRDEQFREGGSIKGTVAINGYLFFYVDDHIHGNEPWISDGTAEGTHLLVDTDPEENWNLSPDWFKPLGNKVLFIGYNTTQGYELWSTTVVDDTPPIFVNLPNSSTSINVTDGQFITTNPYIIKVKTTDNVEVSKVDFYIDDQLICNTTISDSNGIYSCPWDTSKYHSKIKVIAYDTSNNQSVALTRSTTVDPKLYLKVLPKTGISKTMATEMP